MNRYIDILRHEGESYKPLVFFESWRVAVLNYADIVAKEHFYRVERHLETDEIFLLLSGTAFLLVGTNDDSPEELNVIKMEKKTIYNIRKAVWHHVIMSEDASIFIVENADTSLDNSEYYELPDTLRRDIQGSIEI
jgi:ureidoglycolate hydrolase